MDVQLQLGHTLRVHEVAMSPDQSLLASASGDRLVIVWEVASGRALRAFPSEWPPSIAFASDSELVVVGPSSGTRYDVTSGAVLGDVPHPPSDAIALSVDGRRMAWSAPSATECEEIWLADVGGEARLAIGGKQAFCDGVSAIELGPNGEVAADDFATLQIAHHGELLTIRGGGHPSFSPDGQSLAARAEDRRGRGFVGVWDLQTGQLVWSMPDAHGDVIDVDTDGAVLLITHYEGQVDIVDLESHDVLMSPVYPAEPKTELFPGGLVAFTSFDETSIRLVDLRQSVELWTLFAGRASVANASEIAGDRAYVARRDGGIAVWDLSDLSLDRTIWSHPAETIDARADGRLLVSSNIDEKVTAIGPAGEVLWDWSGNSYGSAWAGDVAVVTATDGTVAWLDADTGAELARADVGDIAGRVDVAAGRVAVGASGGVYVFAADQRDEPIWSHRFAGDFHPANGIALSPDGAYLAAGGRGSLDSTSPEGVALLPCIAIFHVGTDEPPVLVDAELGVEWPLLQWTDRGLLAIAGGRLLRIDPASGSATEISADFGSVTDFTLRDDGLMLTTGIVDQAQLWRFGDDIQRVGLAADSAGEWVVYAPDGLFDASRAGTDLVATVSGTQSYAIDQFAVDANRPDVLLQRMGLGDDAFVAHLQSRVERRRARMGTTAHALGGPAPATRIVQDDVRAGMVVLEVEATPADQPLQRLDLYINGVPLPSVPIEPAGGTAHVPIRLSRGPQTIEVAAVDAAGVESPRASIVEMGPDAIPNLWFVGFGVSDYADPRLVDLSLADDDATALGAAFGAMPGFGAVHSKVFVDAAVTPAALDEARAFLADADIDDVVVVFVAGHGLHDRDPESTYYFLPHGADLDRLAATAITYGDLEGLVDGLGARNKLVLLDTCASGELDEIVAPVMLADARGVARGADLHSTARAVVPDLQPWRFDRDRYVYNDLLRRTGAVVFSASRGGEFSYESASLGHGFFTYEILAALADPQSDEDGDGSISVEELRIRVAAKVAARSGDHQHPAVDRDNVHARFGFPRP